MLDLRKIALFLLSQTPEFITFCAEFRREIGDRKKTNYQVAIRLDGIVYKHLPTEREKYFSPS